MGDLDLFANAGDGLAPEHFGIDEHGRAFVEAPALARALQHSNSRKMLQILDEDERGVTERSTPGGRQNVNVVFEEGMWRLIFRSNLPSARSLTKRVTAILRELRETGVVDTRPPMTELEMARNYVAALERLAIAEPAAASWHTLAEATGDYDVRAAAQILSRDPAIDTGQKRLFAYLREIGWIGRDNRPYQAQVDADRLRVIPRQYLDGLTGEEKTTSQLRVTVKGIHDLHKRLGGTGPVLLEVAS